jgi:RNA polymerase sigma-70 factor (ECF subfamily)
MEEDTLGGGAVASGAAVERLREAERALHARLLAGDPTAPSDLAAAYLPPLVARLARTNPQADPHLVETIATDVVLATAEHPERYQPDRGSLGNYLHMAARGDLLNAFKRDSRRAARERPMDPVELAALEGNSLQDDADPAEIVAARESVDPALLALVRDNFSVRDRQIVELMVVDEVRDTNVYARLLGIEHLPPEQRKREVKRVKDRLIKRLRRLAPRIRSDG